MKLRRLLPPSALIVAASLWSGSLAAQAAKDYTARALSGGPPAIRAHAAVAKISKTGELTEVRPGTNGLTCVVGVPGDPDAPFCADQYALQWILDATAGKPKPSNDGPGIAYMSQGGVHYETASGEIVMEPNANTHAVKEPPHWMLMWAVDPATTGLPTRENPAGVYVMFAGTPYAHLMVYQNPDRLHPAGKR